VTVPALPHGCNSWTVVRRDTGEAVLETWQRSVAAKVNTGPYEVLSTLEHLQRFNASLRRNTA